MVVNMGFIGSLEWVNNFSKKQCKSLFWRVRAAVKKAVKKNGGKQQVKFQYDPSSYALNFDDGGCCHLGGGGGGRGGYAVKSEKNLDGNNKTVWVYVVWVES
ncbi:conserved hypothetical protein [Ricinus communis]|uniref:Uncharacterized protein n=1 Tax=Ricinus communis TaxID=3988 RepID=B9S5Y7_RICCO|nr:conserved hypothetical protein [Ricinus communis]